MIDAESDPVVATEELLRAREESRALAARRKVEGPVRRPGVLTALPSRPPTDEAGVLAVATEAVAPPAPSRTVAGDSAVLRIGGLSAIALLLLLWWIWERRRT